MADECRWYRGVVTGYLTEPQYRRALAIAERTGRAVSVDASAPAKALPDRQAEHEAEAGS